MYEEYIVFNEFQMNIHTGLPIEDETSETILRNLLSPLSSIQVSLLAKMGLFLCFIISETIKLFH